MTAVRNASESLGSDVDEREIDEVIARCVAAMVYCEGCGSGPRAESLADIRGAADSIGSLGLSVAAISRRILRPVKAELIARYGPDRGTELVRRFVAEFEA